MSILKIKKIATGKTVSIFVGLALTLSMLGGAAMPAQASTVEELTAQIASLLATITSLQTQLAAMTGGATTVPSYTFTRNLKQGSTGADVLNLQKVLNSSVDTQVAASGVGSVGNETEYFGSLTKAAVIKFQNKYASEILAPVGLSLGTGYVGPSTRAKLNTMGGTTTTTTDTTTTDTTTTTTATVGTGIAVSSPTQPAASLAPKSVARLPFTKVTLTASADGDITVNSLTVERTGLGADAVFSGVVLLDEDGTQLGIAKTFNSNHQSTIGEAFTVKAGTSKTVTVAGNMASSLASYAGQVVSLSVVSINTSATVTGALPITGAGHTVNATLSVGSATPAKGVLDPNSSVSKEIGTTGYTFSSVKLTAGSAEKIRVHSIRWNQSGSVSSSDLENVTVYVDGTAYTPTVSADNKYFTATFGEGIVIDKGLSKEISIKGDIVDGSARTIIFDLYKDTDIYITGETYGYGITPSGETASAVPSSRGSATFTTGTPWYYASQVTVSAGSMSSVSKSNAVTSQNISILSANQPLGGFEVEVRGEPISVQQMIFSIDVTSSTASSSNITNISLIDGNGSVVAGPVDGSLTNATGPDGTVTFTDTVTFPVGKTTLTLKGQLGSTYATNDTVVISTTPSTQWSTVTGQSTGDTISLSTLNSAVTGNTMTVKSGAITVTPAASPVSQNVVMGQTGFTFANFQFDATASGEDVKFTSAQFRYTDGGSDPTNCYVYDGSTKLNNTAIQPAGTGADTYTFDTNLIVPKGTVKTVALKCDIPSSLTANHIIIFGINSSDTISGTGVDSGQTVTATHTTASSGTMTLKSSGSFTVTKDSSSPSYTVAAAGTTGVTAGVLKFTGTDEAINLERIALQLTNTASSSASDIVKVTLWDGSTQVGTALFTGTNTTATSTLSGTFQVPKNGTKLMTVKVDLADVGQDKAGTQGALVAIDYDGDDPTGTRGTGVSSGATINQGSSGDTSVAGVRMFSAYPSFANLNAANGSYTGTITDKELYRFSVTANDGEIGIHQFVVNIATSSASNANGTTTVTNLKVFAYMDSGFSNAVSGSYTNGQVVNTITTGLVSGDNEAQLSSILQIPSGDTRWFKVTGDITYTQGTNTPSGSVTVDIEGDAAYPALASSATLQMGTFATVDADANDDFIWSPNATTTSTATHLDWTNGYGLTGLPSSGLGTFTLTR